MPAQVTKKVVQIAAAYVKVRDEQQASLNLQSDRKLQIDFNDTLIRFQSLFEWEKLILIPHSRQNDVQKHPFDIWRAGWAFKDWH